MENIPLPPPAWKQQQLFVCSCCDESVDEASASAHLFGAKPAPPRCKNGINFAFLLAPKPREQKNRHYLWRWGGLKLKYW